MRCDSHIHVVGPIERYPQLANRSGVMGLAEVATVQKLGAPRGVTRFVIVQPSFYGTDNSMMLTALDQLGGHGRGVGVIDPGSAKPQMLADWHKLGVRGLRLNLYSPIGPAKSITSDFAAMVDIAKTMNWHAQVIAPIKVLTEHVELLADAAVPVVIDHYGVHGASTPDSAEGRKLIEMVQLPHVWMKLSGTYRNSANPIDTKPNKAWLSALTEAAPSRCVWGSDWPHTPARDSTKPGYRVIDYAVIVDDFLAALKPAFADAVMRDNPARLYDYPDNG